MTDDIDYALLSTRVYAASDDNRTGVPAGWTELAWSKDYNLSGFSAGAYRNGNEVVIAYAGTNQDIDWLSDIFGGTGIFPAPQVYDAMRFYLDIKAANPGATITFTGHSLGGGLASLMSVFFDKQAVVFDEAPFQLSAVNPILLTSLEASLLLTGYTDMDFALYNASFGTMFPLREGNVSHIYLEGEELGQYRSGLTTIVGLGQETPIDMGSSTLSARGRHTMTLLTAMLGNTQFASAVQQLPNLATYLLDTAWFGVSDRRTPGKTDLLSSLLLRQYGDAGVTPADGRLDRFTADMQQLVGTVGTAQTNSSVRDALMTASMEYFHAKAATTADKLFAVEGNGLHFKYSDIGAASYKSLPLLARAIETLIGPAQSSQAGVYSQLLRQDAWHIQSGNGGMVWTATGADNDAVIGGEQVDVLIAGAGNDVVLGMGGNDTISGGTGNDILLGGQGSDVYIYNSGDGFDLILDQDGGGIVDDGITLTGGSQYGDARVHRDGNGHIYVKVDQGMMIDGNMFLQGENDGTRFGLVMTGAAADVNPATTRDIVGDLNPLDSYSNTEGVQVSYDELNNVIVSANAEPDRADTLYDSAGNDHISSGGGDDRIYATRGGDDLIEAGTGQDYVNGGVGNDVIMGGADVDILVGGADNDRIYANSQIDAATAISNGNSQTGSGLKGDWLAGGSGADTLVGSVANDVLTGGGGGDLLIGGSGDDDIMGDHDWIAADFNWTITEQPDGVRLFEPVSGSNSPADSAADVIYAGAGNDVLLGEVVPQRHIDRRIKVRYLCKKNFLRYRVFEVSRNLGDRQRWAA